jgi:hypothetical protein
MIHSLGVLADPGRNHVLVLQLARRYRHRPEGGSAKFPDKGGHSSCEGLGRSPLREASAVRGSEPSEAFLTGVHAQSQAADYPHQLLVGKSSHGDAYPCLCERLPRWRT